MDNFILITWMTIFMEPSWKKLQKYDVKKVYAMISQLQYINI